jgi:hypothetical protein
LSLFFYRLLHPTTCRLTTCTNNTIIMVKTTIKAKKTLTKKKKSSSVHESPLTAQLQQQQEQELKSRRDNQHATQKRLQQQRHKNTINDQPSINQTNDTTTNTPYLKDVGQSKKSQKRARREALEDLEEERLTKLLFGGDGQEDDDVDITGLGSMDTLDLVKHSESITVKNQIVVTAAAEEKEEAEESFAFEIDRTGQEQDHSENEGDTEKPVIADYAVDHEMEQEDENSSTQDDQDMDRDEIDTPAWEDPDDDDDANDGVTTTLVNAPYRLRKLRRSREETEALSSHELEQRLRERYEDTAQGTARVDWAKTTEPTKKKKGHIGSDDDDNDNDDDDDDNDDDDLFHLFSTSKSLLTSSRNRLAPNILNIVRCPDANITDPNHAVVRAVHFHPSSDPDQPLLLTAGLDKNLRFFQIGEEENTNKKIHGIHCKLRLI